MVRILVVDDEEDVRGLFKDILTDAGYICDTAIDGEDCVRKIRSNSYDLILMDMFMPGESGRETLERIKNDAKLAHNKVAFLTVANLGGKGRAELAEIGAVDYIQKPIEGLKLIERVKKLVGSAGGHDE
jgi:CheY-like chemotaxis protein